MKKITLENNISEVIFLTGKELLYVDDALGHSKFMMTQAQEAATTLLDPTLKNYAQQLVSENHKLYTQFINLL